MVWNIELRPAAKKNLDGLDPQIAKRILKFLYDRVGTAEDPRTIGKSLTGVLGDYWKYRVGDYRIISEISDKTITISVVKIGNRREVYR
jgi:mRNA interferase RelE/StbE